MLDLEAFSKALQGAEGSKESGGKKMETEDKDGKSQKKDEDEDDESMQVD